VRKRAGMVLAKTKAGPGKYVNASGLLLGFA
jgi:hypothetical protein